MRRIKFVLFLLIALLLFSGCTNSQKEYQSLVGTWETSIDYTPLGYSDIVIYQLTFEKDLRQHRINVKNRIIQWVPNKNCE